jgi:hypothetical protein
MYFGQLNGVHGVITAEEPNALELWGWPPDVPRYLLRGDDCRLAPLTVSQTALGCVVR